LLCKFTKLIDWIYITKLPHLQTIKSTVIKATPIAYLFIIIIFAGLKTFIDHAAFRTRNHS
jgi:hypothetical protein